MNGNWYSWTGYQNGGDASAPAKYVKAWRRIHDIFAKRGTFNVTWVWCPNRIDIPMDPWNAMENYYPGSSYVDWVGFDGYSSLYVSYGFDGLFSDVHSALEKYKKPIMIGEFSCATKEAGDPGNFKKEWINDTFTKIKTDYTDIKLFVWFNYAKWEYWGNNLDFFDWRYDSTPSCASEFKDQLSDPFYRSDIY